MSVNNRESIFIVLIGPAGAGKSVLAKEIISFFPTVKLSISATTRPPREGEINGVAYHFLSREEFQLKVSKNEFFEYEEVHGNFYGTLKSEIESAITSKTDLLFDIDIKGAITLKKRFKENVVCVAIVPPSRSVLEERIKKRGAISSEELSKRLKTAKEEYDIMLSDVGKSTIDFFVVNQEWEKTKSTILRIVESEMARFSRVSKEWVRGLLEV